MLESQSRVLLIGGTSHVGKSTLASELSERLGWSTVSTDRLARHPGRPWQVSPKTVPKHVANHYGSLSVDGLIADVTRHYRENVWPQVESIVATHTNDPSADRLILEGSAILPELFGPSKPKCAAAVWLTASPELLEHRIRWSSKYETKTAEEKELIDKFVARTLAYDERMRVEANWFDLPLIEIDEIENVDILSDRCLEHM